MKMVQKKKALAYIIINIVVAALFIIMEVLGIFVDVDREEVKLLFRVIGRGVLGILILFNSGYLLFSKNPSFIISNGSTKQRIFAGVLLALVGLIVFVTALLGYGTNGDPILRWWELKL